MLARDLMEEYPLVPADADALTAVHLLAEHRLPGLVVVDRNDAPVAILGGAQVLRCVLPGYVLDDPGLARVLDEQVADRLVSQLAGRKVRDLLAQQTGELPVLGPADTVLELAATMAQSGVPLVAVVESGRVAGVVTASRVFAAALGRPENA